MEYDIILSERGKYIIKQVLHFETKKSCKWCSCYVSQNETKKFHVEHQKSLKMRQKVPRRTSSKKFHVEHQKVSK